MHCDLCGREITWGYLIEIEGAKLIACSSCADRGVIIKKVREGEQRRQRRHEEKEEEKKEFVLVRNYGEVLRRAREQKGISREDLAKRLHIPEGYLHKIEEGEIKPTDALARKLEKVLGVKLFEEVKEEDAEEVVDQVSGPITLGDIVKIRTVKK